MHIMCVCVYVCVCVCVSLCVCVCVYIYIHIYKTDIARRHHLLVVEVLALRSVGIKLPFIRCRVLPTCHSAFCVSICTFFLVKRAN